MARSAPVRASRRCAPGCSDPRQGDCRGSARGTEAPWRRLRDAGARRPVLQRRCDSARRRSASRVTSASAATRLPPAPDPGPGNTAAVDVPTISASVLPTSVSRPPPCRKVPRRPVAAIQRSRSVRIADAPAGRQRQAARPDAGHAPSFQPVVQRTAQPRINAVTGARKLRVSRRMGMASARPTTTSPLRGSAVHVVTLHGTYGHWSPELIGVCARNAEGRLGPASCPLKPSHEASQFVTGSWPERHMSDRLRRAFPDTVPEPPRGFRAAP